ncbi:MAG: hypothetical protein U5N85_15965 [Arcicella sp.]|nr:hypothetical protein [Arcicella sp.]
MMKKHLLSVALMIFSSISFAQKITSIGFDLGGNILPLVTRYQGFTGSIYLQTANNNRNRFEYILGYTFLERPNNKAFVSGNSIGLGRFNQRSEGLYFAVGKVYERNFGWHGIVSVFELNNTVIIRDDTFNANQVFTFQPENMVSIGGDFFYGVPIKFSNKVRTNLRMSISVAVGTRTKNAEMILYKPGFNQMAFSTVGFGLSMPVFMNLK